jgi:DNA-binding IclR family transcriptional regulator
MKEVVPAPVRELLRERVQALEQLEVLLLLHDEPDRTWSADELASRLQVGLVLVEAALAHLAHHGFLTVESGRHRYAPGEPTLYSTVDGLAHSYEEARPELLALISSDAMGRVRRGMRQLRDRLK